MAHKVIATIESVRAGINGAVATVEIDELVPLHIDGAVLYCRTISVEPLEPEYEIELE